MLALSVELNTCATVDSIHGTSVGLIANHKDHHEYGSGLVSGNLVHVVRRTEPAQFFVLGVYKDGSTVLNAMVEALSKHWGLPFVDLPGRLFEAGVPVSQWRNDPAAASIFGGEIVYGGFRAFPSCLKDQSTFIKSQKVLLVRDPRDALVSEYFSNAFSHSLTSEGAARDQMLQLRCEALSTPLEEIVVRRMPDMARTMLEYAASLKDPLLKWFRYEDIIADKRRVLEDISAHFEWPVDANCISQILEWADVFPEQERPTEFIRRVWPDNHRDKLPAEVIRLLNVLLGKPMRILGYAS